MRLSSDHNISVNCGTFLSNISLVIFATDIKHLLYNISFMDTFFYWKCIFDQTSQKVI